MLGRNVKRFRGGLVFKARRLLYHSTLGVGSIKREKSTVPGPGPARRSPDTNLPGGHIWLRVEG